MPEKILCGIYSTNECTRDEFQEARKVSHDAREAVMHLTAEKEAYTARYEQFRKMLAVSRRELPLSSIVADIERVTVADGKRIMVGRDIPHNLANSDILSVPATNAG